MKPEIEKYRRGWVSGRPETACGSGSMLSNTVAQRELLPELIAKYGIKSIADIGAGDLNWISHVDLSGIDYSAYDIVPRHEKVVRFDIINQIPPQVDMIMCLWVLNHLPIEHCKQALSNLKASGAKYLLITDTPRLYQGQPEEMQMEFIESFVINEQGDRIGVVEC